MKNKSIILSIALALGALCAQAATPGVTILFSNGQKASFAFASKPVLALSNGGVTISSSDAAEVSYQLTDVQRFYFEDDIDNASVESVAASSPQPVFNYANDVVAVKGITSGERLTVAPVNGKTVKAAKANHQGNATIDLTGEPSGEYVVSTGSGVSFKLLKK